MLAKQLSMGHKVTYHGSLTELHGEATYWGVCCCRKDECWGSELEIIRDGWLYELQHVRDTSYTFATIDDGKDR
jgi:hypothetical protein